MSVVKSLLLVLVAVASSSLLLLACAVGATGSTAAETFAR